MKITPKIFKNLITSAHHHSSFHKDELLLSKKCGCFYCLALFDFNEIYDWWDYGSTASCPRCGMDTVIGSASNYPIEVIFLKAMNQYWL